MVSRMVRYGKVQHHSRKTSLVKELSWKGRGVEWECFDCQMEDKAIAVAEIVAAVQRPNVPVHLALAVPRTDAGKN